MKRLLLILLLIPVLSQAQLVQFPNTAGIGFKRTGGDTLVWIPSDTLQVPTYLNGRSHIARKGTTLYYWNGSAWTAISGGGSAGGWLTTGNAGTTAGTNFIGTTDAVALVVKTNNTERARVLSGGNVGIGLSSPAFKLDVGGTSSVTDRTIGVNGTPIVFIPDQATFAQSHYFGNGGRSATAGASANTSVGHNALLNVTTGFYNTAMGHEALKENLIGTENTAIGLNALRANTGDFNTAVGTSALLNNTTGQTNSAFGNQALRSNTVGLQNSAVGYRTLQSNIDGYFNTAMAYRALEDNTSGYGNSAFGLHALSNNTTGYLNSGFGMYSMDGITTGRGNTGLGYFAGNNASQKVDAINSVALGSYSYTTADNQIRFSDSLTRITIPALPSNVGTKAVRYNPSTGDLSYADTTTGGSSGVTTMAAIGASPNANGATISGSTLNLEPASASFGGVVTTGTQTFAGAKTFNGNVNITTTGNQLSMFDGTFANTSVNPITWGSNYNAPALILNDFGAGSQMGWGLRAGNMIFYMPNNIKFSVNESGSFPSAGTNERFVVDITNGEIRNNLRTEQNGARFEQAQGADVASTAGVMTLGSDGNVFEITGTNSITAILSTNWQNGSEVTLVFTSTATLVDGTANSGSDIGFELDGNTNFVAAAGNVVTLVLSELGGTQRWRMKSKSLN